MYASVLSAVPPLFDIAMSITGTGTHDPAPYLSIGPGPFRVVGFVYVLIRYFVYTALDFRDWLGGEVKINEYCRDLAIRGGKRLAEILGTEEMDKTPNRELTLNMVQNNLPRLRVILRFTSRSM